ncbi:MAG: sugar ABC transporter permease [Lachnospiraceae bacterium]|jgi:multiple sugar transport system permease protein/cellobiose transport system permease protein|nr:sugar ABC transporter permease [Lachnospiraceae bacterium]
MKRNKWPVIFATPFLTAYGLFMLFPMLYSFYLSLFEYNGIVEKHFVGFSNYINLFTKDRLFLKSLYNTVLIMLMSLPVNLILGLVVAYLLFSLARGRRVFQVVNFLPYITTPVAIGFIFSYIFDWNSGILNGLLTYFGILDENYFWLQQPWSARLIVAIMIVWRNFGYCMMIYLSGMTAIDQDIYEAAAIDGAGKFKTFFAIVVPLLKNVSVFLLITAMIGGFQMFDEPVQLYSGWSAASRSVGGPEYSVLTVIWKFYDDSFGSNTRLGYGAAIAYTLFLIIGACSLFSFFWSNRKDS